MNRQPPPPGLVAAAEQDYQAIRDELAALTPMVRALLAGRFTEVEAVTDVWLTLLCLPPRTAAFLGAAAIVQLAKAAPGATTPPGTDKSANRSTFVHEERDGPLE